MSLVRWNPVRDLAAFPSDVLNMQREINRMFENIFQGGAQDEEGVFSSAWTPAVDIAEQENEYLVKMEIPGVAKDDVAITMQNNVLTIKGEKKREKESKGSNYHRVERTYGAFQRSFTLPSGVKAEGIEASYNNGILHITLPKAEQSKPKHIEVKVK